MMGHVRRKTGLIFALGTVLAGACTPGISREPTGPMQPGTAGTYEKNQDAEELLEAQGRLKLVEEKHEPTPVEKHMAARRKVDPDNKAKLHKYAEKDVKEKVAAKDRLLRMEPDPKTEAASPEAAPESGAEERTFLPSIASLIMPERMKPPGMPLPEKKPVQSAGEPDVPSSDSSEPAVTALRIGRHPGKTRLVLDLTGKSGYSLNLTRSGRHLTVQLAGASWRAPSAGRFAADPLLEHYEASVTDKGAVLEITLKKPAKLLAKMALPPAPGKSNRLVFDLAPL